MIILEKEWQPTPVSLPGESHGQRTLVDYSPRGRKESDKTERLTRSLLLLSGAPLPLVSTITHTAQHSRGRDWGPWLLHTRCGLQPCLPSSLCLPHLPPSAPHHPASHFAQTSTKPAAEHSAAHSEPGYQSLPRSHFC